MLANCVAFGQVRCTTSACRSFHQFTSLVKANILLVMHRVPIEVTLEFKSI